ncbi:hypothetical protein NFI96_003301 [Prochilodus magdalenae]|nr:hypothetical protein NFI96_003301 [Prochilodus magdalenae]
MGLEENRRAYVSRAHQVWRNVTGNDPDLNQMEQSILRAKNQKGLLLPVRSKLAEVVGLGSMGKVQNFWSQPRCGRSSLWQTCLMRSFQRIHYTACQDWLSRQPKQVQLRLCCIILGPQGAAMKIDRDEHVHKEFDVEKSVPHVTLLVSEEFEQKDVGEEAVFAPMKESLAIWRSEDQRFLKITITAQRQGQPQTVRMTWVNLQHQDGFRLNKGGDVATSSRMSLVSA